MKNDKTKKVNRSFKYGTMATLVIIGFIVAVILINVIASTLVKKFPLKLDLTKNQIFTMSDDTKQYISKIDSDVLITICSDEKDFTANSELCYQVNEAVKQYVQQNSHIDVVYKDVAKDPTFDSRYGNKDITGTSIIVESNKRYFVLSLNDLFETTTSSYTGQSTITGSKVEQVLTSKIVAASLENVPKVAILSGHGEADTSSLQSLFKDNSYDVTSVDITTSDIGNDVNFIVIPTPTTDYTKEEAAKVDRFLANEEGGKNLIYLLGIKQPELPVLDTLLKQWGIQPENGAIYETDDSNHITNNQYIFKGVYSDSTYSKSITSQSKPKDTYVAMSRPFTIIKGENVNVTEVLKSTDSSRICKIEGNKVAEKTENDEKGPFPHVAVSTKVWYEGSQQKTNNVVVFGSELYFNKELVSSYGNGDLAMNIFNWACGREDTVTIASRTLNNVTVNMTQNQTVTIGIVIFSVILPLLVLILGIVVWLRRRHL